MTYSLIKAAKWEDRRLAHWKLMRAAWEKWQRLCTEHEVLGFNGPNPHEPIGQNPCEPEPQERAER